MVTIKCEIVKKYPVDSGVDVIFYTDGVPKGRLQAVHINMPPNLPTAKQQEYILGFAPGADWFEFEAQRLSGAVADLSALAEGQVIQKSVMTTAEVMVANVLPTTKL